MGWLTAIFMENLNLFFRFIETNEKKSLFDMFILNLKPSY